MNKTDLTGEFEDRNFVTSRGDSRLAMTIAKNDMTVKFGRKNRFLIDDPASPLMLAYTLSKPLKLGWSFNEHGVYKFVLQEVNTTDDDNPQLCIADYYKHFPKPPCDDNGECSVVQPNTSEPDESSGVEGKKVWL